MRWLACLLTAVLVSGSVGAGPAEGTTTQLVGQLDSLLATVEGGSGLYIADPSLPAPLYTRNADEQVITASLYKLAGGEHIPRQRPPVSGWRHALRAVHRAEHPGRLHLRVRAARRWVHRR